jgi:glycosyltransferase involved in cell wall biosynthesis
VRFSNRFMNFLYHRIDYLCAKNCTCTWNYAERMVEERDRKWKTKFKRQIIVPNGISLRKNPHLSFNAIHKTELVYLGTLYEQQGLQLVIEALAKIRKQISEIQLNVVGIGPLRTTFEERVKDLGLEKNVKFFGYIKDPHKVETLISTSVLGLAMYKPGAGFVAYTEPGKVKRYLSCGVPVIMTDVSPLAKQIAAAHCGFSCAYDVDAFSRIVCSYVRHNDQIRLYRKNSILFVKDYEWDRLFTHAFNATRNQINKAG